MRHRMRRLRAMKICKVIHLTQEEMQALRVISHISCRGINCGEGPFSTENTCIKNALGMYLVRRI